MHEPKQPLAEGNAVDYLIRTLRTAPEKSVTLAMLGPETNLALALTQAPDIVKGIREIVIMGGAHFNGGNITRPPNSISSPTPTRRKSCSRAGRRSPCCRST